MTSALALPEQKYLTPVDALQKEAESITVTDQASCEAAMSIRTRAKQWVDDIERECRPLVKQAFDMHRGLSENLNKLKAPFVKIETDLKAECDKWVADERRRQDEARRAAEEKARLAREEAEKIAAEAIATGDVAMAELAQEEVHKIESAPAPRAEKVHVGNARVVDVWKYRVVDLKAFLQGILDGKVPQEAVELTSMVGAVVRKQQAKFNWPGLEAYSEPSTGRR